MTWQKPVEEESSARHSELQLAKASSHLPETL